MKKGNYLADKQKQSLQIIATTNSFANAKHNKNTINVLVWQLISLKRN